MSTVFTMIINGEIPGRFLYRDDSVVSFLTIEPLSPGHALVVPIAEVDKWTDLDPATWTHLNEVAQLVGKAVLSLGGYERAGYIIAGMEVPHTHIHVFGANQLSDFDFSLVSRDTPAEEFDTVARTLRQALVADGVDIGIDPDTGQ